MMTSADVIILAVVLLFVGLAAFFLVRRKKSGRGCCGGCAVPSSCKGCGQAGQDKPKV